MKFTAYFLSGWVICGILVQMRCDLPLSKERKFVDELMRDIGLSDEEVADVTYRNDPQAIAWAEESKEESPFMNKDHEFRSRDGLSCTWWWLPYA